MKRKYSAIIKKIAMQNGVSPEYVYTEMQKAIEAGYANPDPQVQERWGKIARNGTTPPPERVIEILSKAVQKKIK